MAFSYSTTITVDHTKVPSTQTDFPMYVYIVDNSFKTVANGGVVTNSNGYDICFYSDSGLTTPLFWEIEYYDGATGTFIGWLKIPSLSSSTNTVVYVGLGDAAITTFQSTVTSVWDSNFVAVYHLGNGTTLSVTDSTGITSPTNHSGTATTGKLDGGLALNGSQYVDIGNPAALHLTSAITLEAWAKFTSAPFGVYPRIISNYNGSSGYELVLGNTSDSTVSNRIYFQVLNGGSLKNAVPPGTTVLSSGTWYYNVGTYSGSTGTYYLNGNSLATFTQASAIGAATTVNIGQTPSAGQPWTGSLDEIRVSNIARSADWITTCYNSQNSPSTFFTLGPVTPPGGGVDFRRTLSRLGTRIGSRQLLR